MNSTTTNGLEYFKQEREEAACWSQPSSPSDVSSPHTPISTSDTDFNVYHVPRGYDVVLVPLKIEEQVASETSGQNSTGSTSTSLDASSQSSYPSSTSITKPVDIPKSKTPTSTDAKAIATTTPTTTPRLSAYRKRMADKNYIPRPKNCFMAYREHIKERFLAENPGMNNKVVSVLAANMWNNEPEDVKEYWRERAKQLKLEHKLKYPDYKFKPQKKKQNLKTPGGAKAAAKVNGRKKNDSKIIFADELLCDSDDGKPVYSLNLEGSDEQEEVYLTHFQKKAIFGHYRSSSVDSVSSWNSDSTASTPLLSPFVGSPSSLSPPPYNMSGHLGRSSSALRYEAGQIAHNNNETTQNNLVSSHNLSSTQAVFNDVDQLNHMYHNQMDINARANLPVDDGFVLDSSSYDGSTSTPSFFSCSPPSAVEMSSTDYDLMAMGHYTASPIEEEKTFFRNYDATAESAYHQHVINPSSFDISSSQESQLTIAQHYAYALETPRRNSQQLLAEFQHGLKRIELDFLSSCEP
ncbi:17426_t:CDS:1 [Acaulospora morrowiae]|uniref:17426_t:CDS:1 n=1 Tax=Acaulospora morrowiae TaxID=94023 RepID=A0A9N9D688_9GLOM|nr:17426_t:CDS:1 [Acaulospora morrowiae]